MATTVPATSAPAARYGGKIGVAGLALTHGQIVGAGIFVAVHVILAFVMRPFAVVATVHGILCLFAGAVYAIGTRRVRNIAVVAAYIVGCEVLWRMSKAAVFWEFGKYASATVFAIGLLRVRVPTNRGLVLAYFGLLLPSVALTLISLDADGARQQISFNLSGPLALTLGVLFFSNIRQTPIQMMATFWALIGPIVGIGALAFYSTISQQNLEFVNASTAATSGGYAANQVSAMLGLGVLLLLLLAIDRRIPWRLRIPLLALAIPLAAQTALTFARGGLALAFAGICGAMFVLLRGNRRARISVVAVALAVGSVGKLVIEPRLEAMTRGELSIRYTEASTTGRNLFIESELEMFQENPILGVGPGVATKIRQDRGLFEGASHTEYTRMLAEHGVLGALSILCFLFLCVRAIVSARESDVRAVAAALVFWVVLFLAIYGTRLAAPAFVFGLAFTRPPRPRTTQLETGVSRR